MAGKMIIQSMNKSYKKKLSNAKKDNVFYSFYYVFPSVTANNILNL